MKNVNKEIFNSFIMAFRAIKRHEFGVRKFAYSRKCLVGMVSCDAILVSVSRLEVPAVISN